MGDRCNEVIPVLVREQIRDRELSEPAWTRSLDPSGQTQPKALYSASFRPKSYTCTPGPRSMSQGECLPTWSQLAARSSCLESKPPNHEPLKLQLLKLYTWNLEP